MDNLPDPKEYVHSLPVWFAYMLFAMAIIMGFPAMQDIFEFQYQSITEAKINELGVRWVLGTIVFSVGVIVFATFLVTIGIEIIRHHDKAQNE